MLKGDRVTLRPFRAEDLPAMRDWFRDREIAVTWARHPVVPDSMFEDELLDRFRSFDLEGHFAVENELGELIGRADYDDLDPVDRTAELSILLGATNGRGRGYGTDAFRTLIRHLFFDRQVERVWLTVLPWNEPAIRMYEKVGFIHEGVLKETAWIDGRWHDLVVMGLLRSEWNEQT